MPCITKETVRREVREANGAKYVYTLTAGEGQRVACFGLTLYSVSIEMTANDGRITSSALDEIFVDSRRAIRFFDKLVSSLATPIDLPYVLEDEMR